MDMVFTQASPKWSGHEINIQMLLPWGLEQSALVEGFPDHGRGLELNILKEPLLEGISTPKQMIPLKGKSFGLPLDI